MNNKHNKQFDSFIRDFESIRMTQQEKDEMQKRLEIFTAQHQKNVSPYFPYASLFKKTLAFALVLLLLVSASKQASAKALPGDFLYHIKIIHEDIEEASIREPSKKINFEIKRAEKRIQEAVELAKEKKLKPTTQKKIVQNIKEHVQDVNKKIQEIQKKDPEKALLLNTELKTTLKVNSELLKKTIKKTSQKDNSEKETQTEIKNKQDDQDLKNTPKEYTENKQENQENKQETQMITTKPDTDSLKITDEVPEENKTVKETKDIKDKTQTEEQVQQEALTNTKEQDVPNIEEKEIPQVVNPEESEKEEISQGENITKKQANTEKQEAIKEKSKNPEETPENDQAFDFDTDILLSSIDDTIEIAEKNEDRIKQDIIEKETPQIEYEEQNKNDTQTLPTESIEKEGVHNTDTKEIIPEETLQNQETKENSTSTTKEGNTGIPQKQEDVFTKNDELPVITQPTEQNTEAIESEETSIKKDIHETKALLNTKDSLEKLKLKITSLKYIVEAEEKLEQLLNELNVKRNIAQIEKVQSLIDAKKFGQAYIEIEKEIEPLLELKLKRKFGIELDKENIIQETPISPTPLVKKELPHDTLSTVQIQENEAL